MHEHPLGERHDWDLSPRQAMDLQTRLSGAVVNRDEMGELRRIAGVDVGFRQEGTITRAAVAVLSFPGLKLLEQAIVHLPTRFPYIPGLLSFREVPAILAALEQMPCAPDAILCDGQGLAHPRRFGLACHLGVLTGIPCIGVAKSRLLGSYGELPEAKGSWTELRDRGEVIGAVVRSRSRVSPLFVSVGHRVSLPGAIKLVLACCPRYRLPETTRQAHRLASEA